MKPCFRLLSEVLSINNAAAQMEKGRNEFPSPSEVLSINYTQLDMIAQMRDKFPSPLGVSIYKY